MKDITLSPLLAPSAASAGFLLIESGSLAGQRFPLPSPPGALLLGRERMCNVRFDPERDRVVGRTHARMEVRPDGVYLIDLSSANGTFRSDGSAVRGEVRLSAGERFQLGGEGGPWISLQGASPIVAEHVALPGTDAPTLITPPPARPGGPAKPWPPLPVTPAVADSPRILPSRPEPIAPPVAILKAESAKVPDHTPAHRPEAIKADPLALQHRRNYTQQIALISLLLILSCSLGLAIGLRPGLSEDTDEAARGE